MVRVVVVVVVMVEVPRGGNGEDSNPAQSAKLLA